MVGVKSGQRDCRVGVFVDRQRLRLCDRDRIRNVGGATIVQQYRDATHVSRGEIKLAVAVEVARRYRLRRPSHVEANRVLKDAIAFA